MPKEPPATIENRWDLLYRDYPERYDAFAAVPKTPQTIDVLTDRFDFTDKLILDIGSGSGASTLALAESARTVIGLEVEDAMRAIALRSAIAEGCMNVAFVPGNALDIPFKDDLFDMVTAITLPLFLPAEIAQFAAEALRVTKAGGAVINVGIAPFWYGGELASVILGAERVTEVDTEGVVQRVLTEQFGFSHFDFFAHQEYGSVDKIVETYGFIFGQKAIDYLKTEAKTRIH